MARPALDRPRVLALLASGVAVFLVGQYLLSSRRELLHDWINGAWTLISAVATFKSFGTARRLQEKPLRRAWQMMGVGCAVWCAGMVVWTLSELSGAYTPFPSVADACFVSIGPCFVAAMAFYRAYRPVVPTELKHLADIGIAFCLMILLCSIVFYVPLVQQSLSPLRLFATLARVTLFCTAALMGLLCWWQVRTSERRGIVTLLFAGMAVLAGVATWYTYAVVTDGYEVGHKLDVLWVLTFVFFIWAAFEEDWHRPDRAQEDRSVSDPIDSVLPALCVGLLTLAIVAYPQNVVRELRPVLISGGLLLASLLVLREWGIGRVERMLLARARHERDRYRELLWNAPLGIASVNEQGEFEASNPLFAQLLGHEPHSIDKDEQLAELGVPQLVSEARQTGKTLTLEAVLPDGQTHLVFRAAPATASVLLIAENVTESRKLSQQLLRTQKMELVGTLAGGIAHDFNNLLTAAIVGTSLARDELETNPVDKKSMGEFFDQVDRALEQSTKLTRGLLTLGRKQTPKLEEVDPASVAARAVDMLRLALPENIDLVDSLPRGLAHVRADPDQLEQALLNLGLNARDALPQGGNIRIELTCEEGVAKVSVSDDGLGIPAQGRERIFEPFFTTKAAGVGTGLGLAMVSVFAQRHGGSIDVESAPGHGSRFTLTLPLCSPKTIERSAQAPPQKVRRSSAEHILVVDDNEDALLAAAAALRSCGHVLSLARSAADAVEVMNERGKEIELIITDAVMPGQSGAAMLRELRKRGFKQPALVVSAYERDPFEPGDQSVSHLSKPYRPQQLTELVRRLLDEARASI
jgi:signal transduction histidine kinase